MICYKTLFFIDIHIIQSTIWVLSVIFWITICILPVPATSNCIKYKKRNDSLLSALFIFTLCLLRQRTYCISNDIPFCILPFLFYLCRINIKNLKWNVIPSFIHCRFRLFGRSGHSGRYQNNLGIRRLCGICYHRCHCAKHSRGTRRPCNTTRNCLRTNRSGHGGLATCRCKIGMVNDIQIVHVIADCIRKYSPEHIIYDPVMVSTSGRKLMTDEAIEEIKKNFCRLSH